jgi:hypothetical protein
MHNIEMQEMSPEFLKCWQAAGMHLDKQVPYTERRDSWTLGDGH